MKPTTPAKHKTPNYKLVTRSFKRLSVAMDTSFVKVAYSVWEPVPLRATRKDLNAA